MDPTLLSKKIASKALSMSASLAGVARIARLMDSPSHRLNPANRRVRNAGSVVVLALAHTEEHPDLDWWDNRRGGTPGNRMLININRRLAAWLRKELGAQAQPLPYQAFRKGIFLKDAAVLAGLGVIGKNNLLVTPRYGPRVRLRALLIDQPLPSTVLHDGFNPCDHCEGFCTQACPMGCFDGGLYHKDRCMAQIAKDEAGKIPLTPPITGLPARFGIAYCRSCELSCPVGQTSRSPSGSP
jgi:epoxyqueuosine reductase